MTFSVEVDFWPFQAGAPQEAIPRQGAGEGRGKDFASSLLGNGPVPAPDSNGLPGQGEVLTVASLSFLAPAPEAESVSGELVQAPATNPTTPEGLLEAGHQTGKEIESLPADGAVGQPVDDLNAGNDLQQDAPGIVPAIISSDAPTPDPPTQDLKQPSLTDAEIEVAPKADGEETAAEISSEPQAATPLIVAAAPQTAPQPLASQPVSSIAFAVSGVQTAGVVPMPVTPQAPDQPTVSPRRTDTAASADTASSTGLLMEPASDVTEIIAPGVGEMTFDPTNAPTGGDASSGQTQVPGLAQSVTGQPATAGQTASNPLAPQFSQTNAILVATASQLPDIVGRATSDATDDRVVVQLDPPELGRVSIDFKFDAQGLQHVTITAESPEAMRQLRQMHFELVQALERNGLSGQNMSFQHQNPQQNEGWDQQARMAAARFDTPALTGNGLILAPDTNSQRQIGPNGRLDIRL